MFQGHPARSVRSCPQLLLLSRSATSPCSPTLTLNLLLLPSLPTRPTPHCLSTAPASLHLPPHCSPLSRHLLACPQTASLHMPPPPLTRAVP